MDFLKFLAVIVSLFSSPLMAGQHGSVDCIIDDNGNCALCRAVFRGLHSREHVFFQPVETGRRHFSPGRRVERALLRSGSRSDFPVFEFETPVIVQTPAVVEIWSDVTLELIKKLYPTLPPISFLEEETCANTNVIIGEVTHSLLDLLRTRVMREGILDITQMKSEDASAEAASRLPGEAAYAGGAAVGNVSSAEGEGSAFMTGAADY